MPDPRANAFLLPVRVLGKLFRRLFLTRLIALHDAGKLAFFGSMAAGSWLWGAIAESTGLRPALGAAAATIALGLLATGRFVVPGGEGRALAPSRHWPTPPVVANDVDPAEGGGRPGASG